MLHEQAGVASATPRRNRRGNRGRLLHRQRGESMDGGQVRARWRSVNKPGWLNSTGNEYQFTSQAADELFEIWSCIAGIEAANRVEAAIHKPSPRKSSGFGARNVPAILTRPA